VAGIRQRIEVAAAAAGRQPDEVRIVAVSKTFGIEHIRAAAAAGLTEFGENRVQEALQKIEQTAELKIGWHLVGHLQSNKARKAAGLFAWIHSVDSVDLLRRVELAAIEQDAVPNLLVQADLAGEPTKHGASADEVRRILEAAQTCRAVRVRGLMLLPPWRDDPDEVRPYFRQLVALRDTLGSEGVDAAMLTHLSMGMSHDFEVAIEEGATIVRLGTAVFGQRT
jgi:pyridoxal phosphate enzyme (YggS family)